MDERGTKAYDRIVVDPSIMVGKPVVAGTRIPVAVVLRHLALGFDVQDLFAAYPRLTEQDVQDCLRYAADVMEGETSETDVCAESPSVDEAASLDLVSR